MGQKTIGTPGRVCLCQTRCLVCGTGSGGSAVTSLKTFRISKWKKMSIKPGMGSFSVCSWSELLFCVCSEWAPGLLCVSIVWAPSGRKVIRTELEEGAGQGLFKPQVRVQDFLFYSMWDGKLVLYKHMLRPLLSSSETSLMQSTHSLGEWNVSTLFVKWESSGKERLNSLSQVTELFSDGGWIQSQAFFFFLMRGHWFEQTWICQPTSPFYDNGWRKIRVEAGTTYSLLFTVQALGYTREMSAKNKNSTLDELNYLHCRVGKYHKEKLKG